MNTRRYTVTCHWDADAKVWFVADTDVPGLATEGATLEELERKVLIMIPELLGLDQASRDYAIPFDLIARKQELARLV